MLSASASRSYDRNHNKHAVEGAVISDLWFCAAGNRIVSIIRFLLANLCTLLDEYPMQNFLKKKDKWFYLWKRVSPCKQAQNVCGFLPITLEWK